MIHVVQRVHVNTQRVGNAAHVQSERFQQLNKIHFFTYFDQVKKIFEIDEAVL